MRERCCSIRLHRSLLLSCLLNLELHDGVSDPLCIVALELELNVGFVYVCKSKLRLSTSDVSWPRIVFVFSSAHLLWVFSFVMEPAGGVSSTRSEPLLATLLR